MQKKTTKAKRKKDTKGIPMINENAAGIDVSASFHAVAVPEGRDVVNVKEFGAFTEDLYAIAAWLKYCKITTVAMESTGVYWRQLYMVLIEENFEVFLVHARFAKNVTGRKTDEGDAMWIQRLHSCGLLKSSFLPDELTEILRTYSRHRKKLLEDASKYILRMEKAMELMNIKVQGIISDIMGKTGKAIVEAIIGGERKAENFLQYVDYRIKADHTTLVKSMTGNWREEHLFTLEQNYEMYKFVHKQIDKSENEIEKCLQKIAAVNNDGVIEPIGPPIRKNGKVSVKKKTKNQPPFNVKEYLRKIHGVDVTAIFGISEGTALEILAETGTDLSKWKNENHFVSWLNVCPNNKETGGKVISSKVMRRKAGNATQAFRSAANSVQRSDNYIGDYFRRMKSKGGNKYAIIATARKMAIVYYIMLTQKQEFNPIDVNKYREQYKEDKIQRLEKQIAKLKGAA